MGRVARAKRAGLGLAACLLLLPACGPTAPGPVAATPAFPAFPAGCGPRPVQRPAAAALPASAVAAGQPLPVEGAAVSGIAARGRVAFAAPYNAVGAGTLFGTTDSGAHWSAVPAPRQGAGDSAQALGLSPDGRTLAGLALGRLYLSAVPAAAPLHLSWRRAPTGSADVRAFAFDPADPARLAAVADPGPAGTARVFLTADAGRTWRTVALPGRLGPGEGEGIAFQGGGVVVAIGQGSGPGIRLFRLPYAGGAAQPLAGVPAGARPWLVALNVGPRGRLYLLTASALYAASGPGGPWRALPLPTAAPGAFPLSVVAAPRGLYAVESAPGAAPRLWHAAGPGKPWRALPMPGLPDGQLAADGSDLWVAGSAGPVRVGPGGTAVAAGAGIPAPVSVVASAAWRPTEVAAGWSGGLFVSRDGGARFAPVTVPASQARNIASLRFTPDGSCLALVYAFQGLGSAPTAYLSGDGGRNWRAVPAPGNAADVASLLEWPTGSGVWWLTEIGPGAGLYRSAPGRARWTRIPLPPGPFWPGNAAAAPAPDGLWLPLGGRLLRVAAVPAGPLARLRGLVRGPRTSTAVAWGAGSLFTGVAADPYDPAVVYAGLRRSLDGGRSWGGTVAGPTGWDPWGPEPRYGDGIAFGPRVPGAVLARSHGLLRDDGRRWVQFWSTPGAGQYVTGVAPAGAGRFYVAVQGLGLVVAADPRARWHPTPSPPPPGRWLAPTSLSLPVPYLAVSATGAPGAVYRVAPDGRLWASANGGRTFTALPDAALPGGTRCCTPAGDAGPHVVVAAAALAPDGTLYLGLALSGVTGGPVRLGLWASGDGGLTWRRTGLAPGLAVTGIAVAPASGALYAVAAPAQGAGAGHGSLWRSTDGGAHWTLLAGVRGGVSAVAAPGADLVLAGGNRATVWRSQDGGRTFSPLAVDVPAWRGVGLTRSQTVDAVLAAPGGALYAGSGRGVARSVDGGRSWRLISGPVGDPAVLPGGLALAPGGAVAVRTEGATFTFRPRG